MSLSKPCCCFQCKRPQWLQDLSASVRRADRPIAISVPCVGLSAPVQAVRLLGLEVKGVEVCDLEFDLSPALHRIHEGDDIRLGALGCDICRIDRETIVSTGCDALVSSLKLFVFT